MTHQTLRGVLIGCGFFARNHLNAWAGLAGAEIVAVCDRDLDRACDTAVEFDIPHAYDDAAELFAEQNCDFADIATTAASHRVLVELAVQHAWHRHLPKALCRDDGRCGSHGAGGQHRRSTASGA